MYSSVIVLSPRSLVPGPRMFIINVHGIDTRIFYLLIYYYCYFYSRGYISRTKLKETIMNKSRHSVTKFACDPETGNSEEDKIKKVCKRHNLPNTSAPFFNNTQLHIFHTKHSRSILSSKSQMEIFRLLSYYISF